MELREPPATAEDPMTDVSINIGIVARVPAAIDELVVICVVSRVPRIRIGHARIAGLLDYFTARPDRVDIEVVAQLQVKPLAKVPLLERPIDFNQRIAPKNMSWKTLCRSGDTRIHSSRCDWLSGFRCSSSERF